jgi:hypothetical protein
MRKVKSAMNETCVSCDESVPNLNIQSPMAAEMIASWEKYWTARRSIDKQHDFHILSDRSSTGNWVSIANWFLFVFFTLYTAF